MTERFEQLPETHERTNEKPLSRDYFDLQMTFAKIVSQKLNFPLEKILFTHTNFFRRFGFGKPVDTDENNPNWQKYIEGLKTGDAVGLVDYTYGFYQNAPEEAPTVPSHTFGCFNFELTEGDAVYLHFSNEDTDGMSPLQKEKEEVRKKELTEMFAYIKKTYPNAKIVKSGSWLQNLEAYRRHDRYQGKSRWGQFVRRDGTVREDLRERFLNNLRNVEDGRFEEAFPMPTYKTEAPIQVFYDFYGV